MIRAWLDVLRAQNAPLPVEGFGKAHEVFENVSPTISDEPIRKGEDPEISGIFSNSGSGW
jgi:hypothetical protein